MENTVSREEEEESTHTNRFHCSETRPFYIYKKRKEKKGNTVH
jgi:hypothetical protein